MSDLNSLTTAQIEALLRERKDAEKKAEEQAKSELAREGEEFINLVIATQTFGETASTGRWGVSVNSMPFVGEDGTEYTVSVHITDVVKTAAGKERVAQERAAAKAKEEADAKRAQLLAEMGALPVSE